MALYILAAWNAGTDQLLTHAETGLQKVLHLFTHIFLFQHTVVTCCLVHIAYIQVHVLYRCLLKCLFIHVLVFVSMYVYNYLKLILKQQNSSYTVMIAYS